ncbi:MAG: EamA family transporter [Firmicutes bacterium]|nr:EamA family transporter [Bacillota bacterium]
MTDNRRTTARRGLLLAGLAALAWSASPLFIYYIARGHIDAHTQNAGRYLAGGLVLLVSSSASAKGQEELAAILRAWPRLLPALFFLVAYQTALVLGIDLVLPATASLVSRSTVLWTLLLSALFFPAERPHLQRPTFLLGTFLACLGVFGVVYFRSGTGSLAWGRGGFYVLGAAFLWSCYTAYGQRYLNNNGYAPRAFTGLLFFAGSLIFFLLALIDGHPERLLWANPTVLLALFVSGVLCIGVAQVWYYRAMQLLGMAMAANITLAIPFLTAIGSHFLFGDRMTALQWLAGFLLAVGLYLFSRPIPVPTARKSGPPL